MKYIIVTKDGISHLWSFKTKAVDKKIVFV